MSVESIKKWVVIRFYRDEDDDIPKIAIRVCACYNIKDIQESTEYTKKANIVCTGDCITRIWNLNEFLKSADEVVEWVKEKTNEILEKAGYVKDKLIEVMTKISEHVNEVIYEPFKPDEEFMKKPWIDQIKT